MANQFDLQKLIPAETELLTRKEFLEILGGIAVSEMVINHGFRFFPPDTVERLFGSKEVAFRRISFEEIVSESRLILDDWNFFVAKRVYLQAHRAGNREEAIYYAVLAMKADYIDIDANYHNGEIYSEHGVIKSFAQGLINFVADPNEGEFRTVLPMTLEESISLISSLRTEQRQLGVNIELKHGQFDALAFEKISGTLQKYQMPATIQYGDYSSATILNIYNRYKTTNKSTVVV
jgi:hypothetical protein